MNLDTSRWDILLGESLTKPGVPDTRKPVLHRPFNWHDWSTPEWSAQQAFSRLGVTLLEFPRQLLPIASGLTSAEGIALSPIDANPLGTIAHELTHYLIHARQPFGSMVDAIIRHASYGADEYEADAVALLVLYALGRESEVPYSRFYIQVMRERCINLADYGIQNLPTNYDRVKMTAARILAAGSGDGAREAYEAEIARRRRAAVEAAKVKAQGEAARLHEAAGFAGKVKWSR
jgi:hypothetical protein